MKKYIIICIVLFLIVIISIFGSIIVMPKNSIDKVEDIMVVQSKLEKNYSCYGYDIDNPKIVINPYKVAPLSALIMFETKNKEIISVYLVDKSGNRNLLYEEDKERREHYLDIYGLYADYDNKVIIISNGIDYEFSIKTSSVSFNEEIRYEEDAILFKNNDADLVGVNKDGEVLFYFIGFNNKIRQLDNGHLLVTSSRINYDGSYVGFSEIDINGRIYNDYIIENGYKNIMYVMENGNYLVVSDDIIEIDKQNGKILKRIKISKDIDIIGIDYDKDNNILVVKGKDKELYYDYKKLILIEEKEIINDIEDDNKLIISNGNYYSLFKQSRFGVNKKTDTYKMNANLFINKKQDDKYKACNVKCVQEFDRIVVNKSCDDDVYLILDKFMDKRIYKIDKNIYYINSRGLRGDYIIYFKIDKDVYNSGYYIKIV